MRPRTFWISVAAVLALHAASLLALAAITPWTTDEPAYAMAGIAIREHRDWDVFETILQGPVPFLANQTWADWLVPVRPFEEFVFWGRLGMLPFALLLGVVLARFGELLLGRPAALAALVLHCANPVVLANGSLMTVDVAAAGTSLLALFAAWRWLAAPGPWRLLALGAALGLALATKYSAVLLIPVVAVAVATETVRGFHPRLLPARGRGGVLGTCLELAAAASACALVAWLVLWTCYSWSAAGYDPAPPPPEVFPQPRDPRAGPTSALLQRLVQWPVVPDLLALLPAPFVRGLDFQWAVQQQGPQTVMCGRIAAGHPAFHLLSLGTKLPIAHLALLLAGLSTWRPARALRAGPLLALAVAVPLVVFSLLSAVQMGIRYLLPVLPLLMLPAGHAVVWLWRAPRLRVACRGLVIAAAASLVGFHAVTWPYYTSAFNALAGDRPYLLFSSTNLCWPYRPSEDPGPLLARHPGAEVVREHDGPRLAVCVVYGAWLDPRDPRDARRVYHWLRRFDPIDREGPWFAFDAREPAFEATVGAGSPEPDHRGLAELAVARLAAGDLEGAREAASRSEDPDAPRVLQAIAAAAAGPQGRQAFADFMLDAGRADVVLALGDGVSVTTRARALTQAGRWRRVVELLEREAESRPLHLGELHMLQWALRRDGRKEQALALLREHLPAPGGLLHDLVRREIATLESDLETERRLPDLRLDR